MSKTELEVRNQRVIDYLRGLYGQNPDPLRSYIEPKEALMLMAWNLNTFEDLDYLSYPGKFRQSVEDQIRAGSDPTTWAFWQAARLAFLEYGGCYKEGQQPPRNE